MLKIRTGSRRQETIRSLRHVAARWLALAAMVSLGSAENLQATPPRIVDTPEYERLCEAMAMVVQPTIQDATPLGDAVQMLRELTKLDIVVDRRALNDAAIPLDLAVDIDFRGRTLANELAILLRHDDLAWLWQHGVIYITTRDVLEEHLITRVYPVGDLMHPSSGESDHSPFKPLMDVIENSVEPNSWLCMGGSATLEGLESAGALICRHTWQAHQEIESLLHQLRETRDLQQRNE
jgi:hypothetical protein